MRKVAVFCAGTTPLRERICAPEQPFATSGFTPRGIVVAEVPDFPTAVELIGYEDLGIADRFEAGGHPPGASGDGRGGPN